MLHMNQAPLSTLQKVLSFASPTLKLFGASFASATDCQPLLPGSRIVVYVVSLLVFIFFDIVTVFAVVLSSSIDHIPLWCLSLTFIQQALRISTSYSKLQGEYQTLSKLNLCSSDSFGNVLNQRRLSIIQLYGVYLKGIHCTPSRR